MKNRELTALLQRAYPVAPSAREKDFLRQYGTRSGRLADILRLELRYMGLRSGLMVALLLPVFLLFSRLEEPGLIWKLSGALPVTVLVLSCGLGRSERCGMQELEAACRFSLKLVRAVRLLYLGGFSLLILCGATLLFPDFAAVPRFAVPGLIAAPYMLNLWGNLLILRRWHGAESLPACCGATGFSCLLPTLFRRLVGSSAAGAAPVTVLFVLAFAFAVREAVLYLKESEEIVWSCC